MSLLIFADDDPRLAGWMLARPYHLSKEQLKGVFQKSWPLRKPRLGIIYRVPIEPLIKSGHVLGPHKFRMAK